MQILDWQSLDEDARNSALQRPASSTSPELQASVAKILSALQKDGESALLDFRTRFEPANDDALELNESDIRDRAAKVKPELLAAIEAAKANIERFHALQIPRNQSIETIQGLRCELRWQGLERVGLYVPGGSAPLVSSLLMQAIPAMLAGVDEVIVATPGPISPAICAAALACGVDRIFAIGGAQAIGAMAFGIGPVPRVAKIFGPGNAWVTEAKRQVSNMAEGAAIDLPAGPSEVLVIADKSANPRFVAADLLSQAEHGEDSQVILLTDSALLAEDVALAIDELRATLPRAAVIEASLAFARLVVVDDLEEAIQLSNFYAPEHLILQTQSNDELLAKARNAGSIFVGPYTPESLGDYASGTNHVLPTAGAARAYSGLKVTDFMRSMSVQEASHKGLATIADCVRELADFEGLAAHRFAVDVRLAGSEGEG